MASPTAEAAADAPVHPLRSTHFWLFRMFPLRRVLFVLLLANASALAALIFGAEPWVAAGIAVAVFVLFLAPFRGVCLAAYIAEKFTFARQKVGKRSAPVHRTPFDVPLPDGGSYGMRWDGRHVITMLRLDVPPPFVTRLSPSGLSTGDKVPLPELARCLNQFDIGLSSIDIISTGSRTASAGPVARLYDQILGPLPAVAHRTVWVVLRLDPLANAAAVDRRGGGSTGVLRSVIVATQRVANRLAAHGITASVLTGAELNSVVHQLTHGVELDDFTERPDALEHGDMHTTTYRVELDQLGPRGFADMWTTSTIATTVTMRLRRAPEEPGHKRSDATAGQRIDVSALVRFTTRAEPGELNLPGLIPLPGRQYRALIQTLPIDSAELALPEESVIGDADALTELTTPIAGCGQLVGADESGQGVAVPLIGPHVRRVDIVGGVLVAKQVILRAIAIGSTVVVHTSRHEEWRKMVDYVGSPGLTLATWSAGSQQANSHRSANVVVYDGVPVTGHHSDTTVVTVRGPGAGPTGFEPDITLVEDATEPNVVTVLSASGKTVVRMVATPFEISYLGVPEPVRALQDMSA
ncbi:type VII secretion protein EccE [Nocardia puris]|uniref:Type VII secretion protein EccE n=1 Tax=Nocardia puris TaxID=208602 RepID=A0A366DFQ1_9NOCA|nr:type VII secretion protein EccE [Nocardia puris]RBO88907.1 type VII secretion protein EccE [Nocardia puris]